MLNKERKVLKVGIFRLLKRVGMLNIFLWFIWSKRLKRIKRLEEDRLDGAIGEWLRALTRFRRLIQI